MATKRFFKRDYRAVLTDGSTGRSIEFSGLDIKFDIKRAIVQRVISDGKISILGLPTSIINAITATSSLQRQAAIAMGHKISLYAGYENNISHIFTGSIYSATTSAPPDRWLDMLVTNCAEIESDEPYKVSVTERTTRKALFELACKTIDVPYIYGIPSVVDLPDVNSFTASGDRFDIISSLNALGGWDVFIDLGCAYALYPGNTGDNTSPFVVDADSGLLAVSNVTYYGIHATTRLQDNIMLGNKMKLISRLMPNANGIYRIIEKHMVGHFRGNEWITTFVGLRE